MPTTVGVDEPESVVLYSPATIGIIGNVNDAALYSGSSERHKEIADVADQFVGSNSYCKGQQTDVNRAQSMSDDQRLMYIIRSRGQTKRRSSNTWFQG
ncbi:predicted protein [Histoplasma mississippiense (nom. inval.)]|uniref:predicted protein n=1 Tax=Ajellomyces capsulatus (strain NAm1 / WU24) TaxID=2059318 RepID=UPI000157B6CE|nr:predicted protein [Histoplasma mississippiense (nom. inval.)]EDN02481.1 predicted protein [Histoplasma mississippiense (nom. inval.)]